MLKRLEKLAIVGVIILAVVAQLSYIPFYPVKFDQSQVLYLAWDFVAKGILPVHGILNSLRAYNPPFFVWLYLAPMMLTRNPSWVLILPALLLHVLALVVLYSLGRRYFGPRAGLAAAALYAFSERGLYFGHASWAQGLLAPSYVLIVFCLFRWLLEGNSWYGVLLVPLAAWITGLHWGGALAVGVLLLLPLLFRARLQPSRIIAGGLIALALWAPYLGFERDRAFADIRAVVQGRLPVPKPEEITPFCRQEAESQEQIKIFQAEETLMSRWKEAVRSEWPVAYAVSSKVYGASWGMIRALSLHFRWSALQPSFPGSPQERALYLVETAFFLIGVIGVGVLLYRLGIQRTATPAERLLLVSFLLPALLQNLSPHTTLSRPDVSWLFYGPQVLIIAYVCVVPRWARTRVAQTLLLVGLSVLIILVSHNAWGRISSALRGTPNPQRQMVAWIAEDLRSQGRQQASIRYDLLQDRVSEWCWIVSRSALEDTCYIGTEHDYLLLTLYGIGNTGKAPDGWAWDPDYIVLFPEGIHRYDLAQGMYQVMDFESYVVLKVLE